ncbi:hypothetical protein TcWFU_008842 [Taenia crassiceps]|uniref:Transmembrane protein n=1 Tax=Taenia crassiceps TaxID=6207 RepID=A0ABR4QIF1_9CEST
MFCSLVMRRGCRFPFQLKTPRTFSINSVSECVDVYVSADRTRFYKSLGLFCLAQGSAWIVFSQYLHLKREQPVSWDILKEDVCEFTRRLAAHLKPWIPDAVAKVIFQSKTSQVEENVKMMEASDANIDDGKKTAKRENTSDMEIVADRMREAFGIKTATENASVASRRERDRKKRLVPYLCLIMGAFTLFVGAFIPCRVIRRVSLVQSKSIQGDPDGRSNPMMRVNTYGWFGLFPRRGASFTTRLNNMRATAEYHEGKRFMNLIIVRRPFAFYLERLEAEFALPEFFEHLNSKAISR